jgi:hypothetical protein
LYDWRLNPFQEEALPKLSLALTLHKWSQILSGSEANASELEFLEPGRVELQRLFEKAKSLEIRQSALAAERQQVTRELDAVKEQGRELAVRLRLGIRTQFGESEKLIEFGLQPRQRKTS